MNATTIAETIRDQIGLGVLMRIGARGFSTRRDGDGLNFTFTYTTKGGARRVTFAQVVLTGRDDYTVRIFKTKTFRGKRFAIETLATAEGLYADDLAMHLQIQAGEFGPQRPSWEG